MDLIEKFKNKRAKQQTNEVLASLSADERMFFEERAAIMEYDGGLSRDEAERRALEIVHGKKDLRFQEAIKAAQFLGVTLDELAGLEENTNE